METLLIEHGYLLLFLGVMVEGEGFLLGAAFLAHRAYFQLPLVILTAILANCTADQTYYLLARRRGRAWLETRFGGHSRYRKVLSLMERHANWLLVGSRFAVGFRIIIPAACGALGMPPLRFALINIAGGIAWAVPTGLLGYYFGAKAEQWLQGAKRYELWIVSVFILAAALVVLVRHLKKTEWVEDLKLSDLHGAVPFFVGLMGLINLTSAIWPRQSATVKAVESWLPLEVTQRSRPLMLFAGFALLQVTRNLSRRKELAWYVATTALAVSLLLHLTHGLDLQHSLV